MKSTTTYKKWDIILVPFPFTNLSSIKKRPGLVISPDDYNKGMDIVILFITSKIDREKKIGDYLIEKWEESALPKPSMILMKFATIDKSIIIKKLAEWQMLILQSFRKNVLLILKSKNIYSYNPNFFIR